MERVFKMVLEGRFIGFDDLLFLVVNMVDVFEFVWCYYDEFGVKELSFVIMVVEMFEDFGF